MTDIILAIIAMIVITTILFLSEDKIAQWQQEKIGRKLEWRD